MAYPVLEIDWNQYPNLADNIWQAQTMGHPVVLTYVGPDPEASKANRRDAMHYERDGAEYRIPRVLSRDEYPFACTLEGGGASWVGHIPARENSAQGGLISALLRKHGVRPGDGKRLRFVVKVIHHPSGPVVPKVGRTAAARRR
jgi:hypothetical protein